MRHILFFRVDHPTPDKNRTHVDLASPEPLDEVERPVALGAQVVEVSADGSPEWRHGNGTRWVVMQDPEGNEFCIG